MAIWQSPESWIRISGGFVLARGLEVSHLCVGPQFVDLKVLVQSSADLRRLKSA